jgi:exonuclease III
MKPKIVSWNVRGMNEIEKRWKIRRLLREWKADIVCLQETKLEVISKEVIRSVWGCLYVDWLYLGSRGASGGILLMWDRRVVEKVEECVGRFVVACAFRCVTENFEWAFAGIYGPNDDVEIRGLWDELAGLMALWDLSWCIGGDFNVVRYPGERIGESRHFLAGAFGHPFGRGPVHMVEWVRSGGLVEN